MKSTILIDIGGTAIKYGLIDESENLYFKDKTPTESSKGGPYIQQKVIRLVGELIAKCKEDPDHEAAGIAISSAGMVDVEQGSIFYASPTIPEYAGTRFKAPLEEAYHLPCEIENDVNCAGLAEYVSGAGRGSSSMVCLTIGTGIGGCAVLSGKVLHGATGSACEVGYMHLVGDLKSGFSAGTDAAVRIADAANMDTVGTDAVSMAPMGADRAGTTAENADVPGLAAGTGGQTPPPLRHDSFEWLGAASSLSRRVAEAKDDDPEYWDGLHIFEGARNGDTDCVRAIDEMCAALGRGIANICYVLNPEVVVLGGGIMAQKEILYPRIRAAMDRNMIPFLAQRTRLAMAEQGNDAGMIGAYYHFLQMQEERAARTKA